MILTNEIRHIKWYETCKCICRLDKIICNNKQRWNEEKCRCECKELIDKGVCDKIFIWNPSNSECECDKTCNIGEYLDYKNCKCRRKLLDPLVDESTETIEVNIICTEKSYYQCNSCKAYIVFIVVVLIIVIGIIIYFVYYNWSFIKFNTCKETTIW